MCESPDDWLIDEEVRGIESISSGKVAIVASHNRLMEGYRILFKPNIASHGQPSNPVAYQIGTSLSTRMVGNLFHTIVCEFNSDYLDLVMTVRRIFGDDIKDVIDAVGVPDGIIAIVKAEADNSYQLIHVPTTCAAGLSEAREVLLESMPDNNSWKDPDGGIQFCCVFFGPLYQEAVERQSASKNHWMHVPTYRFFLGTLDYYMSEGCVETISLLASESSGIDYRNWEGNTALHTSTYSWYNTEITDALVAANASLTARNINDELPLHVAIRNDNALAVFALLQNGMDPNDCMCEGNSLSSYCSLVGCSDKVEEMINVYIVEWAARKAVEEIRQSALL